MQYVHLRVSLVHLQTHKSVFNAEKVFSTVMAPVNLARLLAEHVSQTLPQNALLVFQQASNQGMHVFHVIKTARHVEVLLNLQFVQVVKLTFS